MRIAQLIGSLTGGGAERVAANISKSIHPQHESFFIISEISENNYEHKGELLHFNLLFNNSHFLPIKILLILNNIFKLRKLKNRYKIDFCISHNFSTNIYNYFSSNRKEKVIFYNHTNFLESIKKYNNTKRKVVILATKYFYKKADIVINVSKHSRDDFLTRFKFRPSKIITLQNGFNVDEIILKGNMNMPPSDLRIFNKKTIISVGRLAQVKNHFLTVELFRHINKKNSDINLLFLGSGPLKESLRSIISEYNLEQNVYFIDYTDNPYCYIKKSEIMILNSSYEGLSNVLIESVILKTKIISLDIKYGPKEIIEMGNYNIKGNITSDFGKLFKLDVLKYSLGSDDSKYELDKYSEEVIELINSHDYFTKIHLYNKFIDYFGIEKFSNNWLSILSSYEKKVD